MLAISVHGWGQDLGPTGWEAVVSRADGSGLEITAGDWRKRRAPWSEYNKI
jgi:hypothetical protein